MISSHSIFYDMILYDVIVCAILRRDDSCSVFFAMFWKPPYPPRVLAFFQFSSPSRIGITPFLLVNNNILLKQDI